MAALLIAMSIAAVMMTVAMPVWKHQIRREREEELIFRGQQYMHAIGLFQRKFPNAYPPNVDVLVEQRFLRKKFKDPITNDDFAVLPGGASAAAPGQSANQGPVSAGRGQGPGGTVALQPSQMQGQRGGGPSGGAPGAPGAPGGPGGPGSAGAGPLRGVSPIGTPGAGGGTTAGVGGVASKSKDQSIRLYNGRSHYNEWAFVYQPQVQQAGQGGAPGTAQPGQVPQGPGQRGRGPGMTPTMPGQRGGGANPFDMPGGGQRGRGQQRPPRGRQ